MQHKLINKNFIVIGLTRWDYLYGNNCKDIALEISKHNQVLYINIPLKRAETLKKKADPYIKNHLEVLRGNKEQLIKINKNLHIYYPKCIIESINWIENKFLFNIVNKFNNYKYAKEIKKAIKKIGFDNYYFFNDNDIFTGVHLLNYLNPITSIYYIRDNLSSLGYWKKHGKRIESKLLQKYDIVLSNSVYLNNKALKTNINSYYIGQGCDFTHFNPENVKKIPERLKRFDSPIIGYLGALVSIRLDISLIEEIALRKPDWTIVLAGPEDETFENSKLHQMKNIKFLGHIDYAEVSEYIYSFDVCFNPQLVNEMTIGNYPRKIDEFLALGKPVVATKTDAMEIFSEYCYLSENDPIEYIKNINIALKNDSQEKASARIKFALSHTWENNVNNIYKKINKYNE